VVGMAGRAGGEGRGAVLTYDYCCVNCILC